MPESEPKPKLIELVAPGAGQGWKATLKSGKAAVIHEIAAPAAEAAAAVPRLQRLAEHRHPALAPVLAWGTDPNGVWVAVEPNEGTPLGTILSRGPLTPPAAAALGAAVLSGVAALHEAGIAMGGFGAAAIRVTGNGEVRLSGHPAAAVRGAPSQSDLRADVRSCGMAICAAFGVDPAGAPAPPSIPPGLVVTMRSMASGAMGPAADRAQGALREMASALLAPDRMTAAQSELALRAGGREMPSITPFLPKETFPPAPTPGQQQPSGPLPWGAPTPTAPQQQAPTAAPFVPKPAPDETPLRTPVSYDAPSRPLETYPPPPAPPVPPPYVPPPKREEPPPPPASYEPPPRAPETFPAVPPPVETPPPASPAPIPTWDAKPSASPEATWGGVPIAPPPETPAPPPAPAKAPDTWEAIPPAAASREAAPAAPAPPSANPPPTARPEPAPPEPKPTWTAIPTPAWTPAGELAPVEAPSPPPAAVPVAATPSYTPPSYTAPTSATTSTSATPAPAPVTAPAPAPSAPARKPPAPRRPVRDLQTERPPWLVPAIAALVVLLLLGAGGGILLAGRGGSPHNIATTSPKATPKASPKGTPSPSQGSGPLAVPTLAPSAAAPITEVKFCTAATPCHAPGLPDATDTSCTINGSCSVDVGIYFTYPPGYAGSVTYDLVFFDRCTGTQTVVGHGHGTAGNAFVKTFAVSEIGTTASLPSGAKSAALIAVMQSPANAAAAPLLLGGDSCT